MHRTLGPLAEDLGAVLGRDTSRRDALGAIDIGMGHSAAGVRLERQRLGQPSLAEIGSEFGVVASPAVRETVEQTVRALEDARSEERRVGKECRYRWARGD